MASSYRYPFAAAPDIIRSHQKDAYFEGVLLEQLSAIPRKLRGARFAHNYTTETKTAAELLYLGLTTFIGNRTLGEEYCDIVQVEDDTLRLPVVFRRGGYILPEGLSDQAVWKVVTRRCALAGIKAEGAFSAHSLRVGFMPEAALQDIPLDETMAMSGHHDVKTAIGFVIARVARAGIADAATSAQPHKA